MGAWGAGIGAVGGILGALGKNKTDVKPIDTSRVIDSGTRNQAIAAGGHVLSQLPKNFDTAQGFANQGADAFSKSASSPDIGLGSDYYRQVLSGKFLEGGPTMQNYWKSIRNATTAAASDQNARARSGAALIGANAGGSTWNNMQAANAAAMNARANEAILSSQGANYQNERGIQNTAPSGLANYLSLPGQLFSNASGLTLQPSISAGNAMQANYLAPWTMGVENMVTQTPDKMKKIGNIFQGAVGGAMGGATGGMGMGGFGGGGSNTSVPMFGSRPPSVPAGYV